MWKPDAVIIVETEIWPNLISVVKNNIPLAIINTRITEKTFKMDGFFLKLQKIFNSFDFCLASNKETSKFLHILNTKYLFLWKYKINR